ncbi:hypothetical protein BDF22DRAFT_675852 [Syncephalis plumigaleata]|nr:hypothetical protein BDF22DRAFT_675852 [Syncephalis plumigaleata]
MTFVVIICLAKNIDFFCCWLLISSLSTVLVSIILQMNSDQVWLNTWLQTKTVVIPLQQRSVTTLQWNEVEGGGMQASSKPCRATMLEETKRQLNKLVTRITACKGNNEDINIDMELKQAHTLKNNINELLSQLEENKRIVEYRMKLKLAKRKRKKAWRQRTRQQQRALKKDEETRREQVRQEIEQWRIEQFKQSQQCRDQKAQNRRPLSDTREMMKLNAHSMAVTRRLLQRQTMLQSMIRQLEQLRELRKIKQRRAGHVFPEDDEAFYKQVQAMDAITLATLPKNEETTPILSVDASKPEKKPDIYQDFYSQASQDLASLVAIRRGWDQYIVEPTGTNSTRASRVPPFWVTPSPPTNRKWAACLLRQ